VKGLDMAKPVKKPPVKAVKDFAFDKGDFVVYPTHGVGKVVDIEAKEIAGHKLELFVISFEQERMMLRVPVMKAKLSGLRKLSSRKIMENALVTLKGRSRVSRAMWNRRARCRLPKSCATCIAMPASPTSPTASGRSMKPPSIAWRASSPPSSASTRSWRRRS
jgi:transcription-repair coupling factor (superfamily II helicase)